MHSISGPADIVNSSLSDPPPEGPDPVHQPVDETFAERFVLLNEIITDMFKLQSGFFLIDYVRSPDLFRKPNGTPVTSSLFDGDSDSVRKLPVRPHQF
jgi:hypothetical protein